MEFRNQHDTSLLVDEKTSVRNCWRRIICFSPFTKYAVPSFLLAVLFVAGVYLSVEVWLPPQDPLEVIPTCHVESSYYVSCVPSRLVDNQEDCLSLACCWREDLKLCYHSFPSRYGYRFQGGSTSPNNTEGTLASLRGTSPFGTAMKESLKYRIERIDDCRTCISLITDVTEPSAEITSKMDCKYAFETNNVCASKGTNSKMFATIQEQHFAITLKRESDSSVVLSTGRGPLIVTDNYWEWTLYLPNAGGLYGLQNLQLNGTRDWIYNNENSTARPVFLAIDSQGNAVSCYLNYDGPLEVQVLNVSNLVVLRGVSVPQKLQLVVMAASGLEVSRQLATLHRPPILDATSLGLHVCPELEEKSDALTNFVRQMAEAKAPWDSHCIHRRLGLALEHGADLTQVAQAQSVLAQEGRIFAPHLTPMLLNEPKSELRVNLERETCLLRNNSDVYVGAHGNRNVNYPDWRKAKTHELSRASLDKYVAQLSTNFIVLRDSWPKDDKKHEFTSDFRHFDYLPEDARRLLSVRTVPWDLEAGKHYARHNAYAQAFVRLITEANVSAIELAAHRCNVESADCNSWESLRSLFYTGLVSSMLGQLPPAMYVCVTGELELCLRWYGLAVAWPHVLSLPENSPGGDKLGRQGTQRAAKLLKLRASLASYQRTVLAKYAHDGSPVFAATNLLYPEEQQPRNTTSSQFLWGDGLLVGLVLMPRRSQIHMWIPGKHSWRHLQDGLPEKPTGYGTTSVLATVGQIVTLVRPGHIIPLHDADSEEVAKSSASAINSNLKLLANGICYSKELHSCKAEGSVYYGADKAEEGEFLYVKIVNATLVLENLIAVRSLVCAANAAQIHSGSSHLEALRLLNDNKEFAIGNLCESTQDIWTLPLKN